MVVRLDWTVPQFCVHCNRQMSKASPGTKRGPNTVSYNAHGMCGMCAYRIKHKVSLNLPVNGPKIRTQFTDTEQQCIWCKQWKPLDNFRLAPTAASGHFSICRFCDKLYQHKLEYDRFLDILHSQNNKCKICYTVFDINSVESKKWCIDHDHTCCPGALSCGRCIRGLLCRKCNGLLGFAKDDVEILQRAINYLIDEKETP